MTTRTKTYRELMAEVTALRLELVPTDATSGSARTAGASSPTSATSAACDSRKPTRPACRSRSRRYTKRSSGSALRASLPR